MANHSSSKLLLGALLVLVAACREGDGAAADDGGATSDGLVEAGDTGVTDTGTAADTPADVTADIGVETGGDSGLSRKAWPGADKTVTVDGSGVFSGNLSGLFYEAGATTGASVIWAVRNGPSTLYRLTWNGTIWTPDTVGGWGAGKSLSFPSGAGAPDAEDLTKAELASPMIYVGSERDGSGPSRPSVLLYDTSAAGTKLVATREWNLTSDLPGLGANLGIEAIAFLPDAYLTSRSFYDERAAKAYDPATYPNHGGGLFMVGIENDGKLYVYALDHVGGSAQRLAVVPSGFPSIMSLMLDRDLGGLYAYCDNNCGNRLNILEIDTAAGSPTRGKFVVRAMFDKPSTMPNLNNEGITFAPESECASGQRSFFFADDGESGGHAIRRDSIPCGKFY